MVARITITVGTVGTAGTVGGIKRRNGIVQGGIHQEYTKKVTDQPRVMGLKNHGHRMDGKMQIGSIYRRNNVHVYTLMILVGYRPLFSPYGVPPLGVVVVGLEHRVGLPRVGLVARGVAQPRGPQARGVVQQRGKLHHGGVQVGVAVHRRRLHGIHRHGVEVLLPGGGVDARHAVVVPRVSLARLNNQVHINQDQAMVA